MYFIKGRIPLIRKESFDFFPLLVDIKRASFLFVGLTLGLALSSCTGGGVQTGSTAVSFGGVDSATVVSPTAVQLSWTPMANVKEYKIYSNLSASPLVTTALSSTLIENLTPDTSYTFKVVGVTDSGTFGTDKEIPVKTWTRFKGVSGIKTNAQGGVEVSWSYEYTPQKYQIFYRKDSAPDSTSTNGWTLVNGETTQNRILFTSLEGSTKYYFLVNAIYRETEKEITTATVSMTTSTTFVTPTYSLSSISIGNLPSMQVTPFVDAKHTLSFYKSTVMWNGVAVSDPLIGSGNIVFSSNANLPLGKVSNISLKVEYNDGNLAESMTVDGLSTFIKGIPSNIETPPIVTLGNGTSYMGKALVAGDFNCDGVDDLAIGVPDISIASMGVKNVRAGAVFVYYSKYDSTTNKWSLNISGTPSQSPANPGVDPQVITFDDLAKAEAFGSSLSAGNLNGDSNNGHPCMDLIVGAPGSLVTRKVSASTTATRVDGAAYIFFGSTKGISAPSHVSDIAQNASTCNGDLSAAICAPVRVFEDTTLVSANLTGSQLYPSLPSNGSYNGFGKAVAFIGDFNADGFQDVAVGEPYAPFDGKIPGYSTPDSLIYNVGAVLVYFGSKFGLGYEYPMATSTPTNSDYKTRYIKIFPPVPVSGSLFGSSIAGGGDIDGRYKIRLADGSLAGGSDMVIGAPGFSYIDYLNQSPLKALIGTTPDSAGILAHSSGNDGWWKANSSYPLSNATNYYGFPQATSGVGAAFIYFGRGSTSAPGVGAVESPTRAAFWQCGRRGLTSSQHYSCLVDNTNVKMLTPRESAARGFGSAVALMGDKSRYKDYDANKPINDNALLTATDSDPLVSRLYFSDANGDGYADVVVTAPNTTVSGNANVGVVYQFFGNPGRKFDVADLYNVFSDSTPDPSKDYTVNSPGCADFTSFGTASVKQACVPSVLRSASLSSGSMIGANQNQISVADVTGDGIKDLAIGDSGDNVTAAGSGAVLIFTSSKGLGLTSTYKKLYSSSVSAGGNLGSAVALGNFNNDFKVVLPPDGATTVNSINLYYDVFAGAPNNSLSRPGGGGVYGFLSQDTSLPSVISSHSVQINESLASFQEFGLGESRIVGDINGDGYADAVSRIKTVTSSGSVSYDAVIYYGSALGLITTSYCLVNQVRIFGATGHDADCYPAKIPKTGITLSDIQLPQKIDRPNNMDPTWAYMAVGAGDVNGDGFVDVLFIPYRNASNKNSVVFFGARGGLQNVVDPNLQPAFGDPQIITTQLTPEVGTSDDYTDSASALKVPYAFGDFNGDGYADLVVGRPFTSSPSMNISSAGTYCTDASHCFGGTFTPRAGMGYPTATANNGWACGGATLSECTTGTPAYNHGSVVIIYGSSRGYQTAQNTGATSIPIYGTESGSTKPCQDSVSNKDPVCSQVTMINPVFENIILGYTKLEHLFGMSVTVADVNKDGYPDLLIGAPGYQDLSCWSGANDKRAYGRVYVIYGSPTGLLAGVPTDYYNNDLTASCPVAPDQDPATGMMTGISKVRAIAPSLVTYGASQNITGRGFGYSLTTAGDVNGDGYEDILISAPYESLPGLTKVGGQYIYYGPLCPADNDYNLTQTMQESDASAINLNRQMYISGQAPAGIATTDLFAGTFTADKTASCFRGSSSSMKPMPQKFYVFGASSGDTWGTAVVGQRMTKGDFNKDGYDDVVIGSYHISDDVRGLTSIGQGVVYFGSALGLYTGDYPGTSIVLNSNSQARPFSILPTVFTSGSQFFQGNLSAGDINGDGSMDLMVTSKYYGGQGSYRGINLGSFFMFY